MLTHNSVGFLETFNSKDDYLMKTTFSTNMTDKIENETDDDEEIFVTIVMNTRMRYMKD